ncbi:Co-chaperone Hsc20 domain-containing protein, partial [Rozella allomycis CSF55]
IQKLPQNTFTYFELLNSGLVESRIDRIKLRNRFLALQRQVHPDNFSSADSDQKNISEGISSLINKAYQTLSDPILTIEYVLEINGKNTREDARFVDTEYLASVMEKMEEIEECEEVGMCKELMKEQLKEMKELEDKMHDCLERRDYLKCQSYLTMYYYKRRAFNACSEKLDELQ